MKEHKHAEVLRAIADGKEVQFFNNGEWHDYIAKSHSSPIEPDTHGYIREWRVKRVEDFCIYESVLLFGEEYQVEFFIDGETKKAKSVELVK